MSVPSSSKCVTELDQALSGQAKRNEPLARHTTFRIGGPADLFVQAQTVDELVKLVELARQHHTPFLILGNGSNVLVMDGGIRGLVIENRCDHYQLDILDDRCAVLKAESGVPLPGLANRLARQGWAGLEWAIGVPGTIGGAVIGNAGAHGGCIADTLQRVTVLDEAGDRRELPKSDLELSYRSSRFKQERNAVILSAEFELIHSDPAHLIARMSAFAEQRRRTQPTDPTIGSMFKNPPGDYAGRLIEQAGLKGKRIGNVEISPVHANFFVNLGGASANDVLQLVEIVRGQVLEHSGVKLELEIQIVGEESRK